MRIAFVTTEFVTESSYDGGLANYLQKISYALLKNHHEVVIITSSNKDEVINYNGISVVRVNSQIPNFDLFSMRGCLLYRRILNWIIQSWRLNQAVKNFHVHMPLDYVQYTSYSATALFKPLGLRSVIRVSSVHELWEKAYGKNNHTANKILQYLEVLALKRGDKVYGPSKIIGTYLQDRFGIEVATIEGPSTLNTEVDTKVLNEYIGNKKYLLFFGTIGLMKGAKEIAHILDWFFEEFPHYFVIAGKDTLFEGKSMIDYMRSKSLRFPERLIYLGSLNQRQLIPIIQSSEAVVLPSRMDNLPNTCLESMALRKVVIGTRGTSFEQLIINQENGFLCNPEDPEDLKKTIYEFMHFGENKLERMSEKAFSRVASLQPENVAEKLVKFLSE